jgi:hypothetical protein
MSTEILERLGQPATTAAGTHSMWVPIAELRYRIENELGLIEKDERDIAGWQKWLGEAQERIAQSRARIDRLEAAIEVLEERV